MTPDFTKEAEGLAHILGVEKESVPTIAAIIIFLTNAYKRGVEASMEAARNHECGGKNDFICQGMNCKGLIIEAIRNLAKPEGT